MCWTEMFLRARRRMRSLISCLPCCFWFLLLFGTGGLVLFIHLEDLSEMVQLGPEGKLSDTTREVRGSNEGLKSPIPPMQFPAFEPVSPGPPSHDADSSQVTKRHRKLLKTNPVMRSQGKASFLPPLSSSDSSSSSSADPSSSQSSLETSRVLEARRRWVREVCAKYKTKIPQNITPQRVSRIFVEDKHKILYCEVPKAGCSNWKRVLMVLAGIANNVTGIKHNAVHYGNHIRQLDSYNREGIAYRLRNYTKVLFVREPLERLVSAYRDKFESPNNYYHPVFGRPIINRYRVNASKEALRTGSGVTFPEFMQYLLDVHKPVGMDIHWTPANHLCHPCLVDYDFIGKFETMGEEVNFVLHRIGAPANLTFPTFKDRNPSAERTSLKIMQRYFAQLNAADLQRVYDFYYMDYQMFNYSKPFHELY
ncbi:carbohydrate sulfotransferase 8-like isoform X1 [Alosa sapidissima]|uniref:carbohydrate sulfotransferase 8-like isoform X1 n=2 Tax=Alosa sapidissima TaxID=34773 RepID=UPI001C08706F|nr:carbohydrate sulfotransferase 8-like isoform X1 [Alosa sapidissima]XP_041917089.1 carbohydrate sulfotransferase 8-like isoform X1 [Alosa sapidissima]XP_041917090.1 carbohydrate sulfotransferase 8-like isoform X1 [Alosa sapidissima]